MATSIDQALARIGEFTQADRALITRAGTLVSVPAGWAPILEGTPADKVYLILEGEVSIRKGKQEVARLGAGELVGETALSRRQLRNATVVAETSLRVLHFTAEAWAGLIARVPALASAVEERALVRA